MPEKVVITRPRRQAELLAPLVAAIGREPVILPLLEISPLPDDGELRRVLAGLADYALVAFVSPNAIAAAFSVLGEAPWPAGVELAVVGAGSRAALARHGILDTNARIHSPLDPAFADSEHLVASMDLPRLAGRRVLVVRGEGGRELLPDALRAAGAEVETVAAYRRTVPRLGKELARSLRALLAEPNDWIITSSEALRGLAALLRQIDDEESTVADMQQSPPARLQDLCRRQRLIVPHARIAETARALGFTRLVLTGSGDERLLAALQSPA